MPIIFIQKKDHAKKIFSDFLKDNEYVLCFYYMNTCGHCINFAPIWYNVIKQYEQDINVVNIEQQCLQNLESKFQVMAFPTIILFKNGKRILEYNQGRNEKELNDFIHQRVLHKSQYKKTSKKNKFKE